MVRDAKEREMLRQEGRTRENGRTQERHKDKQIDQPFSTKLTDQFRSAKLNAQHSTRSETSQTHNITSNTTARSRLRASTERLARSFRTVSDDKKRNDERKYASIGKARALPLPAWKPSPTKTSILREAAARSAKDAKMKAATVKAKTTDSPTRGSGFSFPRASPSRSVTSFPEKGKRPAIDLRQDRQSPQRHHEIHPTHSSVETSNSPNPPKFQRDEYSSFRDSKNAVTDPIFSLRSTFNCSRRLRNLSDDSGHQSSEWSVHEFERPSRGRSRSNTPQSPCTKQNEDFSPHFDLHNASSPGRRNDIYDPSPNGLRRFRGEPASQILRLSEEHSQSSRLLLNSPVSEPNFDPPFEDFESEDENNLLSRHIPTRSSPRRTPTPAITHAEEWYSPSHTREYETPNRRSLHKRDFMSTHLEQDVGYFQTPSKVIVNQMPWGGDACQHDLDGRRESHKSVSWDPAIVAIGRNKSFDVPNVCRDDAQPLEDFGNLDMEDYLDTVTQSFAKLKKSNPKVISQLLAALRDLKSDDESNAELGHKPKLRLKNKPVFENSATTNTRRNTGEKATTLERLTSPKQPSDIQNKLASIIEQMQRISTLKICEATKHSIEEDGHQVGSPAEKEANFHVDMLAGAEVHDVAANGEVNLRMLYADPLKSSAKTPNFETGPLLVQAPKPPTTTPSREVCAKMTKNPTSSKLNPMAPAFLDFSAIKSWVREKKREDEALSPRESDRLGFSPQQEQHHLAIQSDWRQKSFAQTPASVNTQEPIWINTSPPINVAINPDLQDIWKVVNGTPNTETHPSIIPLLPQPQKFSVPPGYIPLIPHPGYISQVAQYAAICPQPVFIPPTVSPIQKHEPRLKSKLSSDHLIRESEPGRVSKTLATEWSQQLLKKFQQKYPLTGSQVSLSVADTIDINGVTTNKQAISETTDVPMVVGHPKQNLIASQQTKIHIEAPFQGLKAPAEDPQHLEKKARASIIQQALEIKILQCKEKKAAKTKEIQKRQIEQVEKILPLVRQRMIAKSADEAQAKGDTTTEPLKRFQSIPDWKRETTSQQTLDRLVRGESSVESFDTHATVRRNALSSTNGTEVTEDDITISYQQPAPIAEKIHGYGSENEVGGIDNVDKMSLCPMSMDAIYDAKSLKSGEIRIVNESRSQEFCNHQHISRASPALDGQMNGKPYSTDKPEAARKYLSTENLQRHTMSNCPVSLPEAKMRSDEISNTEEPHGANPLEDSNHLDDTTISADESLPNLTSFRESVANTQAVSVKSQDNISTSSHGSMPNLIPVEKSENREVLSRTKNSKRGTAAHSNCTSPYLTPFKYLSSALQAAETESVDPWELLTLEEWEAQIAGKFHAASPVTQTTDLKPIGPFTAPKYLWDFLQLDTDINVDNLQCLPSVARTSPRSSCSTSSDAFSDFLLETRKYLALSKPKYHKDKAKDLLILLQSSIVPERVVESIEAVGVDHYALPRTLQSASNTGKVKGMNESMQRSERILDASFDSLGRPQGNLLALVEGSAAVDTTSRKEKSKKTSTVVVPRSTNMPFAL